MRRRQVKIFFICIGLIVLSSFGYHQWYIHQPFVRITDPTDASVVFDVHEVCGGTGCSFVGYSSSGVLELQGHYCGPDFVDAGNQQKWRFIRFNIHDRYYLGVFLEGNDGRLVSKSAISLGSAPLAVSGTRKGDDEFVVEYDASTSKTVYVTISLNSGHLTELDRVEKEHKSLSGRVCHVAANFDSTQFSSATAHPTITGYGSSFDGSTAIAIQVLGAHAEVVSENDSVPIVNGEWSYTIPEALSAGNYDINLYTKEGGAQWAKLIVATQ